MVVFVANGTCEKVARYHLEFFTVAIERLYGNFARTFYVAPLTFDRKATFNAVLRTRSA